MSSAIEQHLLRYALRAHLQRVLCEIGLLSNDSFGLSIPKPRTLAAKYVNFYSSSILVFLRKLGRKSNLGALTHYNNL